MALFSPFSPPGQGRDSVWLFMSMWESVRGCSETHQPSLLPGLGWAEVPVIGSVLSYIHARTRKRSHTIKNPSQSSKDRGEDSVARQIWKMRCVPHNSCQQFDRCLSGTSNPRNVQQLRASDIMLN